MVFKVHGALGFGAYLVEVLDSPLVKVILATFPEIWELTPHRSRVSGRWNLKTTGVTLPLTY